MNNTDWIYYNPDKTLEGLEARYRIKDNVLQIELEGANHKADWYKSIVVKTIDYKGYKYNSYYFSMAVDLYLHLQIYFNQIKHIEIRSHSMGAAVATIFDDLCYFGNILVAKDNDSFQGCPRSGSVSQSVKMNKGDIVHIWPFWLEKYIIEYTDKKWQWFWIAHSDYNWRFKE